MRISQRRRLIVSLELVDSRRHDSSESRKGLVTLSGTVDWHFEKEAAEREIRALSGVVGVSDQFW